MAYTLNEEIKNALKTKDKRTKKAVELISINHWKVLYKLCVFFVDRNSKMTTTAGHSFYIGPMFFFITR